MVDNTEYPIAHVYCSCVTAHHQANEFVKDNDGDVVRTFSRNWLYEIELKNGEKHVFMSGKAYEYWNVGRTYWHDGELYNSGWRNEEAQNES